MQIHRPAVALVATATLLLSSAPAAAEHDDQPTEVISVVTIDAVRLDKSRQVHVTLTATCSVEGEPVDFRVHVVQREGKRREADGRAEILSGAVCTSGAATTEVVVSAVRGRFKSGWTRVRAGAEAGYNDSEIAEEELIELKRGKRLPS